MANLKDIKNRIQSVNNTKKITRAMKMVAAAKVKKAETLVKSARPFTTELSVMFKRMLNLVGNCESPEIKIKHAIDNYPALLKTRELKTAGLLVVTSNKGLAGAYNANVIRRTLNMIEENKSKGIKSVLFVIGQKGVSALKRKAEECGFEIANTYLSVANNITATGANLVAEDMAQYFVDGRIDTMQVVTTRFKNMMSYSVETWDVLPLSEEHTVDNDHHVDPLMIFEPNEQTILQKLVPMYISNIFFQALLEAQASELASRMTAMSAASNNAEEMIRLLSIDYNKARQWAITQELVEIVSGADSLK